MFTWAYGQLGASWERALTDTDGMYAELMASSYSANQPDFAWLEPYEEKSFTQSWYPIGGLGVPVCATLEAALALADGQLRLQATRQVAGGCLTVNGRDQPIDLVPGTPLCLSLAEEAREVILADGQGRLLLRYCPAEDCPEETPQPIQDNPTLDQLTDAQSCYLAGLHVAQYRDPAISPDSYWREALRHDPRHAGAHQELARFLYERMRYEEALTHAKAAWEATTIYNFHPVSGDIPYLMGLILEALGRDAEAADWHQRAAWAQDARSRAMTRLAMIDGRRGDAMAMEAHARQALEAHPGNGTASAALALALRRQGRMEEARQAVDDRLRRDPLDLLCGLAGEALGMQAQRVALTDAWQNALDMAEDLEQLGEGAWAERLLAETSKPDVTAWPSRHGEYRRLKASKADDYGLACLLYAKGHWQEAATLWAAQPESPAVLRNLAIACYSHLNRQAEALPLMERALVLAPGNQQLVWETAYLMGRLNISWEKRIAFLEPYCTPEGREDLLIEYVRALNQGGRYEQAIEALLSRPFTPCEGGEHAVAEQYMLARHALGRQCLRAGDTQGALEHFRAAQRLPDSLGAGLWNEVLLVPHRFFEAECLAAIGQAVEAQAIYLDIAGLLIDYFSDMHLPELRCWQALCWRRLGQAGRCEMMLREHITQYTRARERRDAGYYKTTPFFISFQEPAVKLRDASCDWQLAMAHWAQGDQPRAAAYAAAARAGEPFTLYAGVLLTEG